MLRLACNELMNEMPTRRLMGEKDGDCKSPVPLTCVCAKPVTTSGMGSHPLLGRQVQSGPGRTIPKGVAGPTNTRPRPSLPMRGSTYCVKSSAIRREQTVRSRQRVRRCFIEVRGTRCEVRPMFIEVRGARCEVRPMLIEVRGTTDAYRGARYEVRGTTDAHRRYEGARYLLHC